MHLCRRAKVLAKFVIYKAGGEKCGLCYLVFGAVPNEAQLWRATTDAL